jgi:hypothetical protein
MQLTIIARSFAIALIIATMAGCKRNRELSDTLAWMDNTYNPSKGTSRDGGHGEMVFYTKQFGKQILFFRRTESFTSDGCQMTLQTKDDPSSEISQVSYIDSSVRFNLRDINPQSFKMSTYDPRYAGNSCESFDPDTIATMHCSVAQLDFLTHSEAPLVDKRTHTIFPNTEGSGHETTEASKDRKAYFVFDDSEYASRFAKAFRHSIELCGGKPEPF